MKPAMYRRSSEQKAQVGFTLVEIVVGIVVSAIALTFLSTLFFSNAGRSVEPLLQIRAAEFGQALMDEILAKNFDESTPVGGVPACNPCTAISISSADADGGNRASFNDVDDYNDYCGAGRRAVENAFGNPIGGTFSNYEMEICVGYDNDYDGSFDTVTPENNPLAKLIIVDIYPSSGAGLGGASIRFSAYKGNF